MSYLSKNEGNTYVGIVAPTPTTNLPTAYIGRLYLDSENGVTYRLRDNTIDANVWQSMEIPSQIISKDAEPTFTDNVPDKSLWNDTHIFDAPTNNWLVIKSDNVPTQDMDNSKGYDEGHEIVTPTGTFKLIDGKKDNAIWAKEDEEEPTTSTPCSETGYIIVGKTLFKCYGDGNWYNYGTNTLVAADDPTTITPLPCDIKVKYGNEELKTQNINEECKLKVTVSDRVPTADDDVADGYVAGDIWNVSTTGDSYEAIDTTKGTAKWALLRDRDPTNTDDIDYGFKVGDYWRNYTTGAVFVNTDNADDNAIWDLKTEIVDISPTAYESNINPDSSFDVTKEYKVGDIITNTATGEVFVARSVKKDNALWIKIKSNSEPDENMNKDSGYKNMDTVTVGDIVYTLVDADKGVWAITSYRNPTNTDDLNSNPNFKIGDVWLNSITNESFICFDNENDNAIWLSDKKQNVITADRLPNENDDISKNFKENDLWIYNNNTYVAYSTNKENAMWLIKNTDTEPDLTMNLESGYPINYIIDVNNDKYQHVSDGVWHKIHLFYKINTIDELNDKLLDKYELIEILERPKHGLFIKQTGENLNDGILFFYNKWKRVEANEDYILTRWFGITGDNYTTDFKNELQYAIDYSQANDKILKLPYKGKIRFNTTINIKHGVYPDGKRYFCRIDGNSCNLYPDVDGPALYIRSDSNNTLDSMSRFSIKNIDINGWFSKDYDNACAIQIGNESTKIDRLNTNSILKNITAEHYKNYAYKVVNSRLIKWTNVSNIGNNGGIYILSFGNNFCGDMDFYSCEFNGSNIDNKRPVSINAYQSDDSQPYTAIVAGLHFIHSDFYGAGSKINCSTNAMVNDIWIDGCQFDNPGGLDTDLAFDIYRTHAGEGSIVTNIKIHNNYFVNFKNGAIKANSDTVTEIAELQITNNYFRLIGGDDMIHITGIKNSIISSNVSEDISAQYNIRGWNHNKCIIKENIIDSNQTKAIEMGLTNNTIVAENIHLNDINVTGNNILVQNNLQV